jgi:tRNA uridine 5-carboxymethylaminomethyl modification enzyme
VWSPRAQADKRGTARGCATRSTRAEHHLAVRRAGAMLVEHGAHRGLAFEDGEPSRCARSSITTGTFLNGLFTSATSSGRRAARRAADARRSRIAARFGFEMGRSRPARRRGSIAGRIDFSRVSGERGDDPIVPFSFLSDASSRRRSLSSAAHDDACTTRAREHRSIAALQRPDQRDRPRYCPSLEDKMMRFPTRSGIRSFSSRRASTSTRSTSTACR